MKILAIDTSNSACQVGLLVENKVKVLHHVAPMQQTHFILPLIDKLLSSASLALNQLDAIAFGCGPGNFTGTRIASSITQSIGFATGKPILKISSMAIMAQAAFQDLAWEKCLVTLNARTGKIYWATYRANQDGYVEILGDEKIGVPESVELPNNDEWFGVGDGFLIRELESRIGPSLKKINTDLLPKAEAMLNLAQLKFTSREWHTAADAIPTYF